jgi:DNA-binding transcriptional LysR family regulator
MQHLMVSLGGDPYGFVDEVLAKQGRARRVALTVPNFMFALAVLAETNLVAALPKQFVALHAARFGVRSLDAPLPLGRFRLKAVAPRAAMMDAGLAWLFSVLAGAEPPDAVNVGRRPRQ